MPRATRAKATAVASKKDIEDSSVLQTDALTAGEAKKRKRGQEDQSPTFSARKSARKSNATSEVEDNSQVATVTKTPEKSRSGKVSIARVKQESTVDDTAPVNPHSDQSNKRKRGKGKFPDIKEVKTEDAIDSSERFSPAKSTPKKKVKNQNDSVKPAAEASPDAKVKKRRKTKEEKEAENMPLAARTLGHKLAIGAHVSSGGGVENALTNALHIGYVDLLYHCIPHPRPSLTPRSANSFALFLQSQRKWTNPPLSDSSISTFHARCSEHSYDPNNTIVPHGSYLVNLAHTDPTRSQQAFDFFLDDLRRCEKLGITLYNLHPGSVQATTRPLAIAQLAKNLNRAHAETSSVVTLLENMAAKDGNTIGATFQDLADVISQVENKSRVGVCLDTCHAFAAGYDLRSPSAVKATLDTFDKIIGIKHLRALHMNDSKCPFDGHKDLHANIGTGFIGLRGFHAIVNEPRLSALPMVLETPIEVRELDGTLCKDEKKKIKEDKGIWAREIKMLESFIDMNVDSKEFYEMEQRLQGMGKGERDRIADQVTRGRENKIKKQTKAAEKNAKAAKSAKGVKSESTDESELSDAQSQA